MSAKTIVEVGKESLLSENHLVKTKRGWTKAKDLKENDEIQNHTGEFFKITDKK